MAAILMRRQLESGDLLMVRIFIVFELVNRLLKKYQIYNLPDVFTNALNNMD